uniref:PMS1-like protein n=1 Tax=Lingulaulax polyedra TaxID=160621 RepID=A0A516AFZ9_LINPO|nr:PMS1-like protein [Lingulodinium polyedra]
MDRLDRNVVHEICTNQVVVTLHACVKELVENSLDAGATRIEVRLRESGSELLEVVDNGRGVQSEDYAKLATRHATSKIRDYDDISNSLATFGFRGEALSAICAMGDMTVSTRTAGDTAATLLAYDRFGKLTSQVAAAREVGTTVSVRELFRRLPVRHREFLRNAKAQVSATLRLIQAYSIARPEIRFHVIAEKVKGHGAGRATLLSTSGSSTGWRQAAAAVLGDAVTSNVESLELRSETTGWSISGLISSPHGGRRTRDAQLYFVNQRPIDPPKRIAKLINDTYHQYNSRMWPVVILSFTASQGLVDVNVTPDKRTVFLHNEEALLSEIQEVLTEIFTPKLQGAGPALADFGIRSVGSRPAAGASAASAGPAESAVGAAGVQAGGAADGGTAQSPLAQQLPAATSAVPEAQTPQAGGPLRRGASADAGGEQTPEKPTAPAALAAPAPAAGAASCSRLDDAASLPGLRLEAFMPAPAAPAAPASPARASGS